MFQERERKQRIQETAGGSRTKLHIVGMQAGRTQVNPGEIQDPYKHSEFKTTQTAGQNPEITIQEPRKRIVQANILYIECL